MLRLIGMLQIKMLLKFGPSSYLVGGSLSVQSQSDDVMYFSFIKQPRGRGQYRLWSCKICQSRALAIEIHTYGMGITTGTGQMDGARFASNAGLEFNDSNFGAWL